MSNPNANKTVGDPCAICNTPLIQGKGDTIYCKPCYVDYANKKKAGGGSKSTSNNNGNKSEQDLRSIVTSYSKDIVVALINAGHIKKSETAIVNIKGIAVDLYNYVSGQDEIVNPKITSYVD